MQLTQRVVQLQQSSLVDERGRSVQTHSAVPPIATQAVELRQRVRALSLRWPRSSLLMRGCLRLLLLLHQRLSCGCCRLLRLLSGGAGGVEGVGPGVVGEQLSGDVERRGVGRRSPMRSPSLSADRPRRCRCRRTPGTAIG